MVKSQVNPKTGAVLPPFGVDNLDEYPDYKKFKTADMEERAVYVIKANAPMNTEAYSFVQVMLTSGRLKLLIDEREAKTELLATKLGQNMSPEQRAEKLMPYTLTTALREQMSNLVENNDGINIILSRSSRMIPKDKFSALCYGLYYIKKAEGRKKKRHGSGIGQMLFYTPM